MKLGAAILCSSNGIILLFPNGDIYNCSVDTQVVGQQLLLSPTADITNTAPPLTNVYWGLLAAETPDHGGLLSAFLLWKPWISLLAPYSSYHVTLFYDKTQGEVYQEQFLTQLQDTTHTGSSTYIWVGPEGVSAGITLPPELLPWFEMASESVPHCTFMVRAGHHAKGIRSHVQTLHACY